VKLKHCISPYLWHDIKRKERRGEIRMEIENVERRKRYK
jgi:hypothetical protein